MTFVVHTIPAFSDNYLWLIQQEGSRQAYVVDPGDAVPIQAKLAELNLELAGILVTHQHPDHIAGIPALLEHRSVPVYGPADISVVSHPVSDGDTLDIAGETFEVIAVPGHTLNHIAYYAKPAAQSPVLFCGDTLFACGCGRLFEGTPEQMYRSLQRLSQLPPGTLAYCAHEYTMGNINFALAVEPDNQDLQMRMEDCQEKRSRDCPTVPFTLSTEIKTNPFLRSDAPSVIAAAKQKDESADNSIAVFTAIRHWKDNFWPSL